MLPKFFAGNRKFALLGLVIFAIIQASLTIVIAFNMRELFANLRDEVSLIPFELIGLISLSTLGIITYRVLERTIAEQTGHDYTQNHWNCMAAANE